MAVYPYRQEMARPWVFTGLMVWAVIAALSLIIGTYIQGPEGVCRVTVDGTLSMNAALMVLAFLLGPIVGVIHWKYFRHRPF